MTIIPDNLIWWITAVELPALAGLLAFIWRTRKDSDESFRILREMLETRNSQIREAIAAYKLEVAKTYASNGDLKELEARLVAHLLRIESKLDATALKAEGLSRDH